LRRLWPDLRRGQEVVLVIRDTLWMLVPVGKDLRMLGQLLSRVLMLMGMSRQQEQVRHHRNGEEKKSGGESAASRHAEIVPHPVRKVKPSFPSVPVRVRPCPSVLARPRAMGGYSVLMRT
jgi:hypothetical protein